PETPGLKPGYEQRSIPEETRRGRLVLLASRDGREGSVLIRQDAALFGARLDPGQSVVHAPAPGHNTWVHVARGAATLNGKPLVAGDGAAVSDEKRLTIAGALAGAGRLSLALVLLVSVVASLLADALWYEMGRRKGVRVLQFLCRVSLEPDSCVRRTELLFGRYGVRSLVVSKFVPGLSTAAPPLAGIFG